MGSELQLGLRLAYANYERGFASGPEVVVATKLLGNPATKPFSPAYTSVEMLVAGHYSIKGQVNLGLAGGIGQYQLTGTPDARALFRLAYAPMQRAAKPKPQPKSDRDHDTVPDTEDGCPDMPGHATADPATTGCPDRDGDGVRDPRDLCPNGPMGAHPDPQRLGCPVGDRDQDGILESEDKCPDEAAGSRPDPNRAGCPASDRDGDHIFDHEDACPEQPGVPDPDPKKLPRARCAGAGAGYVFRRIEPAHQDR